MNQQLVEFHIMPDTGNLQITLTPEGRDELQEMMERGDSYMSMLCDLLEYQMCNGWNWLAPCACGALTESPLIAWGAVEDEKWGIGADKDTMIWWIPDGTEYTAIASLYNDGYRYFLAEHSNKESEYYGMLRQYYPTPISDQLPNI